VSYFNRYPAGRIYSFPPPLLVSGFYSTLLGSTDKRRFSGYALAEAGRHTPHKAVTGSIVWLPGAGNGAIPPPEQRPRIEKALYKHFLAPQGERELVPGDTV
jgi:hypothetical protein